MTNVPRIMPLDCDKIKQRREQLTLTMEEAATRVAAVLLSSGRGRVKFNRQRWNDVENGRSPDLRLSTAEAIATVLEWKIDDLLKPARRHR